MSKKRSRKPITPQMRQTVLMELLKANTAEISAGRLPDTLENIVVQCEFVCNYLNGKIGLSPENAYKAWMHVYGPATSLPRKEQERYSDKIKSNYSEFVQELSTEAIIAEMNSITNKESDFYIVLSETLASRK